MYKRYKVSHERYGYADNPDPIPLVFEHINVKERLGFARASAAALRYTLRGHDGVESSGLPRDLRLPDERAGDEGAYHRGEHLHRVPQADLTQQDRHRRAEDEREHGAPERHNPVNQAETPLEVVPEDRHRRRVDQARAEADQDPVREVQQLYGVHERADKHPRRGDHDADTRHELDAEYVDHDAGQGRHEERHGYLERSDPRWKTNEHGYRQMR